MTITRSPVWFVRAGEGGSYAEDFLASNLVAIGWRDVGPLPYNASDSEIENRFLQAYPHEREASRRSGVNQVRRFLREPREGDPVATYDPARRLYFLGTISGPLEWREHRLSRFRCVTWTNQVPRDLLSAGARNRLGSAMTLFRLPAEVTDELFGKGSGIGTSLTVTPPPPGPSVADAGEPEEQVIRDTEVRANEFVEDRLARLDWKQMQELVAALLRAMGYKTRVAEEGPDRGIDIFASPDGLGLQEPRIFVEVKHRPNSLMGAQDIRSFLGGRKPGDRCLYVSAGGFTKDARYEAERAVVPVTLLTLKDLRELLVEHYEGLGSDSRSLVPLRRIYLPAPD